MSDSAIFLFKLLRIALGNENDLSLPFAFDLKEVMNLSIKQGVAAIAVDGLQKIFDSRQDVDINLDKSELEHVMYDWFGFTLSSEKEYALHQKAICDLAEFYNGHGIRMMVLKGYGLSLNYPEPSHRPMGDIDIYNFGSWKEADEAVEQQLGLKVDRSHHHHTLFNFEGQMVENHYDFINTKAHRDAPGIEAKLKTLAENSFLHTVDGVSIFLPSANFNALFLIRHAGQHFAGERLNLRQVLDWALFVDRFSAEMDWTQMVPYYKEIGIWDFCCALDSVCVSYLGFDAAKFPGVSENAKLVAKIVDDIVSPEFNEKEPLSGFLRRVFFRARRWWHNRWKHPLVYKEWWLPMVLTLAWSHIRKPEL